MPDRNNESLIANFYIAFAGGDAEGMACCYHEQIEFEDPAFGKLKGEMAKNMWRMLVKRGNGKIQISYSNLKADENRGSADWQAVYPFGPKGRKVVNNIHAEFEFKEGLIIKHTDTFDLWKWTRQALGIHGYALGWSNFMKKKIQAQSNKLLKAFSEVK